MILSTLVVMMFGGASAAELVVPAIQVTDRLEKVSETTASCPIAAGAPATLALRTQAGCGGSSAICTLGQRVTLLVPGAQPSVVLERVVSEGERPLPRYLLKCEPGRLTVVPPSGKQVVLDVDAAAGTRDSHALVAELEDLWKQKPGSAGVRSRVAELDALKAAFTVRDSSGMVSLLAARGDFAAGRYADFDERMRWRWPALSVKDAEPWAADHPDARVVLARAKELLAQRKAQADRTQPFRLTAGRRIGKVLRYVLLPQALATAMGGKHGPDVFWRAGTVCVFQEDESKTMRCYDAAARRWGAAEPLVPREARPTLVDSIFYRQTCATDDCGGTCSKAACRSIPPSRRCRTGASSSSTMAPSASRPSPPAVRKTI